MEKLILKSISQEEAIKLGLPLFKISEKPSENPQASVEIQENNTPSISRKAPKRKFRESFIGEEIAKKFDGILEQQESTRKKRCNEMSDREILLQNNRMLKRIREDIVLIKNMFGNQNNSSDEWMKLRQSLPFSLPLSNLADVEACENFIATAENKEKLVRYFSNSFHDLSQISLLFSYYCSCVY